MRATGWMLLGFSLLLSACNAPDDVTPLEEECAKSLGCMDWNMVVSKATFPPRMRVLVNDTTILDECEAGFHEGRVNRGVKLNTIEINKFLTITEEDKFKLSLVNLGPTCYEETLYYEKENQPFKIRKLRGEQKVWIEILN